MSIGKSPNKKKITVIAVFVCCVILVWGIYKCWNHYGDAAPSTSDSKAVHLSIDDVEAFVDLSTNSDKYSSIWEQPFFQYLKKLHDSYGIRITLYTYESTICSRKGYDKYRNELSHTSDWLRVGFHWSKPDFDTSISKDQFKQQYLNTVEAISNLSDSLPAHALRLHYYFAPDSLIRQIPGFHTFLCAPAENRQSYDLTVEENRAMRRRGCISKEGRKYRPTDIQIENHWAIERELRKFQNKDTLVVFTHEWALSPQTLKQIGGKLLGEKTLRINALNRHNLESSIQWLNKNNYQFTFLENG